MSTMHEFTITVQDNMTHGATPEIVAKAIQEALGERLGIDQCTVTTDDLEVEDDPSQWPEETLGGDREPEYQDGWDFGTGEEDDSVAD